MHKEERHNHEYRDEIREPHFLGYYDVSRVGVIAAMCEKHPRVTWKFVEAWGEQKVAMWDNLPGDLSAFWREYYSECDKLGLK